MSSIHTFKAFRKAQAMGAQSAASYERWAFLTDNRPRNRRATQSCRQWDALTMNRLPEIGERVRYHSVCEYWDRQLTGTVRKIYEGYEGMSLVPIPVGDPEWNEQWAATVEVDERPDWWAYGESKLFAPRISELEPLHV